MKKRLTTLKPLPEGEKTPLEKAAERIDAALAASGSTALDKDPFPTRKSRVNFMPAKSKK